MWSNISISGSCIYKYACQLTAHNTSQHLSNSLIHAHIHTLIAEAGCKVPTYSAGTIWVSVFCPRMLGHAARGVWDSSQRPSDYWTTYSSRLCLYKTNKL